MMCICQADGYYDMSEPQVSGLRESLLNPELFQFHLTAFLGLLFPFATFLVFFLVSDASAAMFKLYLGAEGPALSEIVTHIDHGVGDVEASMARIVLVLFGLTVSAYMVTKEITAISHLAIAAD